ncbi:MAG: hypothetical protein BLITH_1557 [Brockia lithotrophica]|uniref:Uncharacterized protein n=1 Tax=Brockia lithotrophica TaxID=933949 RepID=A0A2T5G5L9_9BACL|nr:MAG: hypothetical protein BLITH_1557 [Brockia lithotrophica]
MLGKATRLPRTGVFSAAEAHTRDGDSRPVFCFPLLLLLRFVSELPIGGIPKQLPEEETSSPTGANVRRRVEGR